MNDNVMKRIYDNVVGVNNFNWRRIISTVKRNPMAAVKNEEDFEYLKPKLENGRFQLPWKFPDGTATTRPNVFKLFMAFLKSTSKPDVPSSEKELDKVEEMQILPVDQEKLHNPDPNMIQATWIGHAGFLIQLGGMNILFDPVFSNTIGPVSFMGNTRYRKCPLQIGELPNINIVCISHDHFDHCDLPSLKQLDQKFGTNIRWCVPLKFENWLENNLGKKNFLSFNWWDSKDVQSKASELKVNVECVPAQHWCLRGINTSGRDENTRLWAGWIVKTDIFTVYHAGDTGYCDVFKSIGNKHGPIDLAMIPIGAYCPRKVLKFQHVDPEEAVQVHQDVKAVRSIAMHWGTFELSREYYLEPPLKLKQAMEKAELPIDQFMVLKHGETVTFSKQNSSEELVRL